MSGIFQRIISFLMSLLMPLLTSWGIAVKHFDQIDNVKYDTGASQVMNIYLPKELSGNGSAVLFLHDGNFKDGSRGDMDNDCQIIANKGYVAATMDYTLLGGASNLKETVMGEITNAINTLKKTAADHGVTLKKLALSGYGAGGYYALMYAYGYTAYSILPVQFVAVKGAPADLSYSLWKDVYSAADFAALVGALAGLKLTAEAFENNTDTAKNASASVSPASILDKPLGYGKTPTLAAYAANDAQVPYANLQSLEAALVRNSVAHTLVNFPNSEHDFKRDVLQSAEYSDALSNFCSQYLSN